MDQIDVRRGHSRHLLSGHTIEPSAIHFNVQSQHSRTYDRELRRLEFGRLLGRTPVPDVVTALVWSGRRLSGRVGVQPMLQRVRHGLHEGALLGPPKSEHVPEGIRVRGDWHPVLKMEWQK